MFRALRVEKSNGDPAAITASLVELDDADLMPGDVTVDVEYSSINFKDGLALCGRPGVIKNYPLVAGIDLVGVVAASDNAEWMPGDRVILNGWGIGEKHHGGLAERARVSGDWLVRLPDGLDPHDAAAIGTAGYTSMLAVLALERHGIGDGDVLVTGAAGGVGSIAIALLAGLGHRVVASTGRLDEKEYLAKLGASEVIDRALLGLPGKPLQSQRWAAAVDSAGSHTLANVLAQTNYGGIVASCGLAQGADLPMTVMPFILRAVTLAGINSVQAPRALREEAWGRLARDLDRDLLDSLSTTVGLGEAPGTAEDILAGRIRGRTVVDVRA
ncbi:acrylyl-CoA reductase (NADPH) [Marisediminicola sp. UYEF4]|uniref:acrylyl-CoA reductase (NADPH) n=1 Tax=Marisediminicola sp. UYEF4 TaxID=1756384 RepID=UPI003396BC09